jgi:hypothetical protein
MKRIYERRTTFCDEWRVAIGEQMVQISVGKRETVNEGWRGRNKDTKDV